MAEQDDLYDWELDGPAQLELPGLPNEATAALAEFLSDLVFDPVNYQRTPTEAVGKACRILPFGDGRGFVTFLVHKPDRLVLVTRIQWHG